MKKLISGIKLSIAATFVTSALMTTSALAADEVIQQSFFPYAQSTPSFEGLAKGMVIDKSNVAQFKDVAKGKLKFVFFLSHANWARLKTS